MVRSIVCCSLLLWLCLSARSQVVVKGKLIDEKTNSGIGFVTVSLLSSKDSAVIRQQIADSAGVFELADLRNGRYNLLFSALGYQSLYKELRLETQTLLDLGNISMTADPKLLGEVVVSGSKPAFQLDAGKLVVNVAGNKIFKTSANAFDILKRVPGLEVAGDGTLQMSGRITPAVFIDGKPVPMSAEELQNYLRSLSPDMIASIEVISNPSAQYDGEHKGIINIRLKPDMSLGWKGMVTTNIQQNAYTITDNNFLLTYKTKKLAYTARFGYNVGSTIRTYRALQYQANTNIMTTNTKMPTSNNNFNIQLGADYTIQKDQRIEILLRTYQVNRKPRSFNTLHITDSSAKNLVSYTNSDNYADLEQDNYAAGLNYIARLGKKQFQLLGSIVKINNRQLEDIQNRDKLTTELQAYWKTKMRNDILIRTIQADLSGELGKGKWSTGARFAFTTTKNDLHYDTLNTGNVFVTDSGRTNNFHYDEYITAGYITYERKLDKFNIVAGLRAEHTHSVANAVTIKEVTERNYLTWLPSLNVTYAIRENSQLSVSLSRRITRPGFAALNPFRFYFSPLNYWIGNPYLLPSKTNMLRVSYSLKSFTASVHIGRETDPMVRYPEYDRITNILQYLGRNLPYNDFAGIEISFPFTPAKWWKMSHNIGGYYKKEQTPYHGITYTIPIKSITVTGSQVFTLPKGFTFDLYYYFSHPGGDGLYRAKTISTIDLGLQKTWLKGKLNSKINYYDLLDDYKVWRSFREKSIIDNTLQHWFGAQKFGLTLSYSFGKSTYKARPANKNDEEARTGM